MNISSIIPQSGYMVFLDEVKNINTGEIVCTMTVKENSPFISDNKLGSYTYIEIMAQAIAAYAGINDKIDFGFLLSCRKFNIFRSFVAVGEKLEIYAKEVLTDGKGMFVFDCAVKSLDEIIANATLSVLNPSDDFLSRNIYV